MDTFATRLKYARKRTGLNQSELARRVGIKPQSIQYIESGSTQKSRYALKIAANVLGVNAEWLVYGVGSIEPTENVLVFRENIAELQRRFLTADAETQNWVAELLMGGSKDILALAKMLREVPESQRQAMQKAFALLTQLEN